ncbi:MAG: orotate phosphoribosyltransferase [Minisyncoccia bacterium]
MQQDEFFATLFEIGAIQIDTRPGHGFEMRIHDTDKSAPLSPIYFNLRTSDNPKPGPLTPELVAEIGDVLWETAQEANIEFDGVCGIPNAGVPLAHAFYDAALADGIELPVMTLEKEIRNGLPSFNLMDTGGLEAVNMQESRQNNIRIIDDVLTYGGTKDAAIHAVAAAGYNVTVLVFCDRQQGGAAHLLRQGITPIHAFTAVEIISVLRDIGKVSSDDAAAVLEYLEQTRA